MNQVEALKSASKMHTSYTFIYLFMNLTPVLQMKKGFTLLAALLIPFLVSGANQPLPESERQRKRLKTLQTTSMVSFFDVLPLELRVQVLKLVPIKNVLLVCHDWEQIIQNHFLYKLKPLFDTNWFEVHFQSLEERDTMLTKVIVSDYSEFINQLNSEHDEPISPKAMTQRIKSFVRGNWLVKKILLAWDPHPKERLLALLSGADKFRELPLEVRQGIAELAWDIADEARPLICSFLDFVLLYHEKVDSFSEFIVNVNGVIIQKACLMIALGIGSAKDFSGDRERLVDSLMSLIPQKLHVARFWPAYASLSPNSSITEVFKVLNNGCPLYASAAFVALQSSPEHACAAWSLKELGREKSYWPHHKAFYCLLFSKAFLKKHNINEAEQIELLQKYGTEGLFKSLPYLTDLTDPEIQDFVDWINERIDQVAEPISFACAVVLYSLDKSPNALNNYVDSFQSTDLKVVAEIILGINCGRFMNVQKRIALLKHLFPQSTFDFAAEFNGNDRKQLLIRALSPIDPREAVQLVDSLSDLDFSLWVETCFDNPISCEMEWSLIGRKALAARVIANHIDTTVRGDTSDSSNLLCFPKYYLIVVFFLTTCDEIASVLSEFIGLTDLTLCLNVNWAGHCYYSSDLFENEDPIPCFSHINFSSWDEVARASRRVYSRHSCPQKALPK